MRTRWHEIYKNVASLLAHLTLSLCLVLSQNLDRWHKEKMKGDKEDPSSVSYQTSITFTPLVCCYQQERRGKEWKSAAVRVCCVTLLSYYSFLSHFKQLSFLLPHIFSARSYFVSYGASDPSCERQMSEPVKYKYPLLVIKGYWLLFSISSGRRFEV